ncbi:MAG: hypothetical protein HYY06_30910 [Deltaproteobacteria bacterium]|nr:hypothetical protein [Deltaproteobacteria bacterium]
MKPLATLVALVALVLAPGPAAADDMRFLEDDYRSPQNFAFELRLGPYYPAVDDELATAEPFRETFGDNSRLRIGLEFDWQFLSTPVGSLGVGVAAGLMRFVGNSRFEGSGERSSEETTLNVFPIVASVVARLDFAMREWQVPLVLYGKAGVADYLWFVEDGSGKAHADGPSGRPDAVIGQEDTFGVELASGIAFLLDFLEPGAARKLDADSGVNHSYLFLEVLVASIDGLGERDVMIFSDTTWNTGLLLEF